MLKYIFRVCKNRYLEKFRQLILVFIVLGCGSNSKIAGNMEQSKGLSGLKTDHSVLSPNSVLGANNAKSQSKSAECDPSIPEAGQRLTKLEYGNVIRDIFGLDQDFSKTFALPSMGSAGFSTEGNIQNVSSEIVLDFYDASVAVANAVLAKPPAFFANCTGDESCVKKIIDTLILQGYRRPPMAEDTQKFFKLYTSATGANFSSGMKLVIRALLLSPHFIFRTPDNTIQPTGDLGLVSLSDFELASKLSFFIWGSVPDEELLKAAAAGQLKDPKNITAHALRLLKSPKSVYLSRTFGDQWLGLAKLDKVNLDTTRFPDWNASVRNSMRSETLMFIDNLVKNDLSPLEIIKANYSFADQNIAKIYGISGGAATFEKVSLDANRRGILSQPALLAMNSAGDHTTPVQRGKWVLEKMLCAAPPPPPDNIPALPVGQNMATKSEAKIRERLAAHRTQGATCTACHTAMDPIGLTFENFDSSGIYRSKYADGTAIDASGVLPTGEKLKNFVDLANVLEQDKRFSVCFVSYLSSFANGIDMMASQNKCLAENIAKNTIQKDMKISDVVLEIVMSTPFRFRKIAK